MKKTVFIIFAGLLVVASCSKKAAPTTTAATLEPLSVYKANCSRCHGETGVEGKAPNLSMTKYDKAGLIDIIAHGKDRMPAFEKRISAAEIEAAANYIVSIKK